MLIFMKGNKVKAEVTIGVAVMLSIALGAEIVGYIGTVVSID